jgi:hypothetical protein
MRLNPQKELAQRQVEAIHEERERRQRRHGPAALDG